jgi:KaiC/GvpD/RAD55 family RecA-like ATPase
MPTPFTVAAHVAVMVGVLWVLTAAGSRLFPLKRFVWAGYAGLSAYLLVSAAYSAGVVSDLIEYLYLGYLAQTVSAASALAASLHALNRLVEIRVNFVPVVVVAVVAVPVVVTAVLSGGAGLPYGLLSYHLMVAGFAFYVFISYFYVVLGRFSQRLGLVTASLFYGGGIVFAGVAALYLYVTGRYLSGTFNFSVYTTYLFVESVMGLAGTAAGVAGTWRFRQVKPVETGVARFTGVEVIDEEMGFRHPSIVVVSGPPGSGRTTVLTKLAATRLAAGDSVAFFCFDDVVDHVCEHLAKFGCDVERCVEEGRLAVFSSIGSGGGKGAYVVKAEPNEVNITFSQALTMLRTGRKWVVIDSITPIMVEYGPDTGLKLLRTLTAKARLGGVSLWVSYNSTAFTPQTTSLVEDCFEGVVELAIEERNGVLTRVIRIPHMEGRPVSGKWSRLSPP